MGKSPLSLPGAVTAEPENDYFVEADQVNVSVKMSIHNLGFTDLLVFFFFVARLQIPCQNRPFCRYGGHFDFYCFK